MQRSRWLWRGIAAVSVTFALLFACGFAYAVKTVLAPSGSIVPIADEAEDAPLAREASVEIVALGDSLTFGYGDSTGRGYVGRLRELLEERTGVPTHIVGNFAANGYTTLQVLADLNEREGIAEALRRADLVVMTVGGNDLLRLGDEIDVEAFRENIPETQANIREILVTIRDITPEAPIYYIGLYNPFIEYTDIEGTSLAVQAWNAAAFETLNAMDDATFVPTFDLFQRGVDRFLASDRYHPNDEGYARIAERLAALLE
ncbi:MAG TPA: GDSL-type esterase/lipase family protein [Paenibacillus sp.]|nr:GDSL-type esterase/lipase family protein [Paenibacillus sp.]